MGARSSNVRVSILGEDTGLTRTLAHSTEETERFADKTKESFEKVHEAGKLLAEIGGLTALTFGLKDVTEEAVKAEAEEKKLANTVKDAGLSWRAHSAEIDEWLDKTSRASGFAKSDLDASLGNLIRTTGSLTKAQKLDGEAMDVARSKGVGLANAQSILARVYNGSYTGLKRLGISVKPVTDAQDALAKSTTKATAEQKEHAKALDQQATRTEALGLVQQKFGGQSDAYAKSTAGSFERAKQSLNLFEEQVGTVALPLMADAANGISSVADAASKEWPKIAPVAKSVFQSVKDTVAGVLPSLSSAFDTARDGAEIAFQYVKTNGPVAFDAVKAAVQNAMGRVAPALETVKQTAQAAFSYIRANGPAAFIAVRNAVQDAVGWFQKHKAVVVAVAAGVGVLVTGLVAYRTVVAVVTAVTRAWTAATVLLDAAMDVNPITLVVAAIAALAAGMVYAYEKSSAFRNVVNTAWADIKKATTTVFPVVKSLVVDTFKDIAQTVSGFVEIFKGVIEVFSGLIHGDWGKAWDGVKDIAGGAFKALSGIFKAETAPLRHAFGAIFSGLAGIASDAFQDVVGAVKLALNAIISVFDAPINAVNSAIGLANKLPGPNLPKIPTLPHFADGGMIVPGSDKRDGTLVAASGGEAVLTYSGQGIVNAAGRALGVPDLMRSVLAAQVPHFADGGVISGFRQAISQSHAPSIVQLALWEAGIVESGLRNLNYGDRDSVGALQQRPSQGWTGLMDPTKAALEFIQHAEGKLPWKGTAGQLAQAVQVSAYPARYDAVEAQAEAYMGSSTKGASAQPKSGKSTEGPATTSSGPPPAYTTGGYQDTDNPVPPGVTYQDGKIGFTWPTTGSTVHTIPYAQHLAATGVPAKGIPAGQQPQTSGDAPTAQDSINAQIALSALTPGSDDDMAAAILNRSYAGGQLDLAKQTRDPRLIQAAAQQFAATIDAVNQLTDSLNQANALQAQRDEVNQTMVENQTKLLAIAGQGDAILAAVIAAVSGGIGGRVGLASQTPAFAGQMARY